MPAEKASNKVPIAIIGLSGMIGNCKNSLEIWDSLYNEKDEIHSLSDTRKAMVIDYLKAIDPEVEINENYFIKGCLIDNPFEFDNKFFNINLLEAQYLDPSFRKMLEVAYKAFENAGLTLSALDSSNTGVYVGYSSNFDEQFSQVVKTLKPLNTYQALTGTIRCKISNYISQFFNLNGPSLMIDTSSSSGLVSIYSAVKALQHNECDIAFAGSSKINCLPYLTNNIYDKVKKYFSLSKLRAFDNKANGFTFGEGAVGLVLKPLKTAIKDGDFIHAVICGGALNYNFSFQNNSKSKKNLKKKLMLKALENSNVKAEHISYIEADGIGIKKEDKEEITAMSEAFSQMTNNKQFCCVGSVKTNFGHTGCVSGLAGIMKVILAMQKNVIPANLNLKIPNKDIDFINSPFYVSRDKTLWNSDTQDVYAAVNSYGFFGTNCCIILKNFQYMKTLFNISGQNQLFVISAKNEHSLLKLCLTYSNICSSIDYDYDDFVYTLCFKREHYNYRFAAIFSSYEELSKILIDFLENKNKYNMSKTYYGVVQDNQKTTKINGIKPLDELARFYISGGTITRKNIKLASYKTVNLPTYEFLKTTCDLNTSGNSTIERRKYDLINGACIRYRNQILHTTKISCKKLWESATYFVKGINSLSLGSLFEIILQTINTSEIITFSNIVIDKLFQVDNANEKELIIINKDDKIILESENKDENTWHTHLSCNYKFAKKSIPSKLKLKTDLCKDFCSNCDTKILEYITVGQRWHSCEKTGSVNKNNSEFLISLSLDEKYKCEVENYYLHPVLFDLATNIIICYADKNKLTIPISIGSITVYKPKLPSKIDVHIIRTNDISIDTDFIYNIDIYDTNGKILLCLKDYYIKSFDDNLTSQNKFSTYINQFNEIALSKNSQNHTYKILYFGDTSTSSLRYSEEISKKGHRVYFVDKRQSFDAINNYVKNKKFDFTIVSCFDDKSNSSSYTNFSYNNVMEFNFLKTILNLENVKNKKIAYLLSSNDTTNNKDSIISPEYNGIIAMVTAFSSENNDIDICCFDIDKNSNVNTAINEIVSSNHKYLLFKNDKAFYKFRKITQICKTKTAPIKNNNKAIIITGYKEKSQIIFANHLKEKGFNNIVIFTYCDFPDEIKTKFTVINVNILNQGEVIKAVNKVRDCFSDIHGVINLCDEIAYGTLKQKSLQSFRQIFDINATSINNMHIATLNDNLEFFVTFSSIITPKNMAGFSDYAAANATIEAFAIYRNQLGHNSLNISLPPIQFSYLDEVLKSNCEKEKFTSIKYEDVFDIFDRLVFGNNINPVVIYGEKIKKDSQEYYLCD